MNIFKIYRSLLVIIIAAIVVLSAGCTSADTDESDQVIAIEDLPEAVKPLVKNETKGCRIIEIEKEAKDGKTIYAVTYDRSGTVMEIEYTPDGKLVSKGRE